MTLDGLARALRSMPRDAPMLVRLPDGSLRGIAVVRPVLLGGDGGEVSAAAAGQGRYAITLELTAAAGSGTADDPE
jgi:hypothetical protein